jgi:hypothetical protein
MGNRSKDRNTKLLILLFLFITAVAIAVAVWALFFRAPQTPLVPDYAPQETEAHMETIPGDTGSSQQPDSSGGSVSLTYTRDVTVDLSDKQAMLLFANPGKSNQDMVIQIIIQDVVICQSGTLTPGHQVKMLDLLKGTEKLLSAGVYEGKFNILYYHPESGEKAIVNTEIPVTITVQD